MAIEYEVAPLGEEIEDAFARLFEEDAAEKTPARLRWRFCSAPHGPGFFAVARDTNAGNAIIGMVGVTATRLRVRSADVPAYQAVDLIVDPTYRGRGVFKGLGQTVLDAAESKGARVVWGFPNKNAAPGWFGRFAWRNLGMAPFMFRPLRTGYFLRKISPVLGRINIPLILRSARNDSAVSSIGRFGPDIDRLWDTFKLPIGCTVERDSQWLNWRLVDRPDSQYRSVGSYNEASELKAMVSSCLLNKHGGNIFYIMEAMSAAQDSGRLTRLLRHELRRASADGAEVALSWCPRGAPNRQALFNAGFLPLPEKLRPVAIHFGARPLSSDAPPEAGQASAWYVSYLDSDTV